MDAVQFALLAEGGYVILLAVALLYPLYAYGQNVMHREAVLALVGTLLVYAVSVGLKDFLGRPLLGAGVHVVADLLLVASLWLFAREFVRTNQEAPSVADTGNGGGFEDAE